MTGVLIEEKVGCSHVQRETQAKAQGEESRLQAKGEARKEPVLLLLQSWTSRLQNREEASFCCSSHPVCETSLWQSQQYATRTGPPQSQLSFWGANQDGNIISAAEAENSEEPRVHTVGFPGPEAGRQDRPAWKPAGRLSARKAGCCTHPGLLCLG